MSEWCCTLNKTLSWRCGLSFLQDDVQPESSTGGPDLLRMPANWTVRCITVQLRSSVAGNDTLSIFAIRDAAVVSEVEGEAPDIIHATTAADMFIRGPTGRTNVALRPVCYATEFNKNICGPCSASLSAKTPAVQHKKKIERDVNSQLWCLGYSSIIWRQICVI